MIAFSGVLWSISRLLFVTAVLYAVLGQSSEAITLNPDDIMLRAESELVLGRSAARQERADVAESLLRSAAALFASKNDQRSAGRAQARLGRLLMETGRPEAAMAQFYSAAVKATGDQELAVYLARALRQSGDARACAHRIPARCGGATSADPRPAVRPADLPRDRL